MDNKLKYRDERDKTYGIAGMVIAMVMTDGEEMLVEVSLDAPAGESLRFTPDFYFSGNPRLSAKLAWNQLLRQFSIGTGMLMGNVMCRSYLLDGSRLNDEVFDRLRQLVRQHGEEMCSLEQDEADTLFSRNYNYFDRVFNHSGVAGVAHNFASELQRRRSMSLQEILEQLRDISRF